MLFYRRGVSEILSAMLMVGIVIGAGGGLLMAFGNNLSTSQASVASGARAQIRNTGKLITFVYSSIDGSGHLQVEVYDYGFSSVTPASIYVDGAAATTFALQNTAGATTSTIGTGTATLIVITGQSPFASPGGHTVDLVDADGFSLELKT